MPEGKKTSRLTLLLRLVVELSECLTDMMDEEMRLMLEKMRYIDRPHINIRDTMMGRRRQSALEWTRLLFQGVGEAPIEKGEQRGRR